MKQWIEDILSDKENILKRLRNNGYLQFVEDVGALIQNTLEKGNKIILAGNGGSAADAQHFAGELVGRFMMERPALTAISLCVDPSVVTCIANDYGYDQVFARQLEGNGRPGDVFIAISTGGNSRNLINAVRAGRDRGIKTVGFLGRDGGALKKMCDYALVVPSDSTPRIQEIHTLTIHILCRLLEESFKGRQYEN